MDEKVRGTLLIIGGGERRDGPIPRRVVELAGGEAAFIVVITTAARSGEETGEAYRHMFRDLGAGRVEVANLRSRADAGSAAAARRIAEATGIFMSGGDQLRLTSILAGTRCAAAVEAAYAAGRLVAGTSAGAAAMSDNMIVEGPGQEAPRKCTLCMAPGLGLLEEVVIDQHFAQRGRLGRLLAVLAQNPYVLGVGIDEDTAIEVEPDARFRALGSGAVTVLDGRDIGHSSASEGAPEEPLALTGVRLHVLPEGYGFDLQCRLPLLPILGG